MSSAKPFYLIAHRVLTVQGVRDALSHGANAIEIDMYASKAGWRADHDGWISTSVGDTAEAMFIEIAAQRQAGKPVTFVWLDIKNQTWADPHDPKWAFASVLGLRDLARQHLEPAGVRVLFGFYSDEGVGYRTIVDEVNEFEAVNHEGDKVAVQELFNKTSLKTGQRVMSKGYFNTKFKIDNITEQLHAAAVSQDFGKVFGWTVQAEQGDRTTRLLDTGVDGVIYGFEITAYYDHAWTQSAAKDIIRWVEQNSASRRVAGINDKPW